MIEQKKNFRRVIRKLKNELSEDLRLESSELIMKKLSENDFFIKAKVVLLYYSMKDEVFTHHFIEQWYNKKIILLPVVKGETLDLKVYRGKDCLIPGDQFGIPEPDGTPFVDYESIDCMVIPGVAFDKNKNRMGRGRGFYDRLLSLTDATKIGVCFNFQMFDNIPVEEHDIKMDEVIFD